MSGEALIIGGGISGTATAVKLARGGFDVTLVEREDEWRALGHGITMIGPALRALQSLELLDEALESGYGVTELRFCSPAGTVVQELALPRLLGPDRPGLLGMMRPRLHEILARAAAAAGVQARTGTSPTTIGDSGDRVTVALDDDTAGAYDVVVVADGLFSSTRALLGWDDTPQFVGQGVFRAVLDRVEDVTCSYQFVGHPSAKAGFTPTGPDSMYMFCTVPANRDEHIAREDLPQRLCEALSDFGGIVAEAREQITDPALLDFRLEEWLILKQPWNRGRVVVLGDAAHATTPHLAAGAAMCLEDAIVLGEELADSSDVADSLDRFAERRRPRCERVVRSSVQLAEWELAPDTPGADPAGFTMEASAFLAQPF